MFPKNRALFEQWMEAVNNPQLASTPHLALRKTYSVCNEHFRTSQFQTPQRIKLLTNAVPYAIPSQYSENTASVHAAQPPTVEHDQRVLSEEISNLQISLTSTAVAFEQGKIFFRFFLFAVKIDF